MRLTIDIEMDGAAFWPDPGEEVERILQRIARQAGAFGIESVPQAIHDANGNRIGTALLEEVE
jgi:hypothetical protein